jgi:hypothetical protein
LEYLSTALEVRRREGHEPIFSLDPVDATDKNSMQEKVFVPEWLAGTSAGDVLFQADYHLKELSMGEYDQPVVGMKSCFDYSEMDGKDFQEWSAREWFLVRKAEVQVTDSNILLPCVKMGVEAREQVIGGQGFQDKQITRTDHPMVKYAEAFTKNFDLIAERKSVVYHLRELAKASVLAKHLLDANVSLDESWFHLRREIELAYCLEVPQLWNERLYNKVQLKEGTIVRDREQKNSRMHGVFGGVAFGLDKFNLSASVARTTPLAAAAGRLSVTSAIKPPAMPTPSISQMGQAPLAASVSAAKFNLATSVARQAPMPERLGAAAPVAAATPLAASVSTGMLPVPARAAPSLATSISLQAPAMASVAPGKPTLAAASLDKFDLAASAARAAIPVLTRPTLATTVAREASIPMGMPQQRVTFGLSRRAALAPISAITSMATGAAFVPPAAAAVSAAAPSGAVTRAVVAPRPLDAEAAPRLQGVDLRLDTFDLSSTKRVSLEAQEGSWSCEAKSLDQCVSMGDAFWSCLESDTDRFAEDDRDLLKAIFNPGLSDRRCEGDLFTPPDAGYANVTKLRALVKEEEKVRQRRKELFFSKDFVMEAPGPLFPASWAPSVEIGHAPTARQLCERTEYTGTAAAVLQQVLKSSIPVFDRMTEEGLRFLIYQLGSLEVRTTQDADGEETIGSVFAICSPRSPKAKKLGSLSCTQAKEKIIRATEYVERMCDQSSNMPSFSCHYYVVFETEQGRKILLEHNSKEAKWDDAPVELEDRNSLAKVIRTVDRCAGVTVGDMKTHYTSVADYMGQAGKSSCSTRKRFAKTMFNRSTTSNKQR